MMALRHEPSEHTLAALLYDRPHKPRLSREAIFAITAALAVHAAFGVYIYTQKFTPMTLPVPEDVRVLVDMMELPKITPPPPPPRPDVVRTVIRPTEAPPIDFHVDPILIAPTPTVVEPPAGPAATLIAEALPPVADTRPSPLIVPPPRVIRNANWLVKPTAAQMDRLYPRQAAAMGISGGATLMCDVAASGSVSNCNVIDESPKGRGFGAAALAGSRFFKMNPKTVDGKPIEGAQVRIPIIFNLAD